MAEKPQDLSPGREGCVEGATQPELGKAAKIAAGSALSQRAPKRGR